MSTYRVQLTSVTTVFRDVEADCVRDAAEAAHDQVYDECIEADRHAWQATGVRPLL